MITMEMKGPLAKNNTRVFELLVTHYIKSMKSREILCVIHIEMNNILKVALLTFI